MIDEPRHHLFLLQGITTFCIRRAAEPTRQTLTGSGLDLGIGYWIGGGHSPVV